MTARTASQLDDDALPVPRAADAAEVLRVAAQASDKGVRAAMATVLARRGSTPSTPGQKLVLTEDGECAGTVGGGAIERETLRMLIEALTLGGEGPGGEGTAGEGTGGAGRVETFKLGAELGMCCGGGVDVVIERLDSAVPTLIVGAGHVGSAVAPLLARCGFAVTLVDDRDRWAERGGEGPRLRRIAGDFVFAGRAVPRRGIALAMTHDHQLDQRVIEWALKEKFAFVGGVGSRAKAAKTRARLEAKGFSADDVARVRMPIGLDIRARTPDEIAVSIVAELVGWKRKGDERR
jgi:xanthine dehydrogenase accessory factor